jgi:extracellular sulfatase Sulf
VRTLTIKRNNIFLKKILQDPFETQNMESTLTPPEKSFLHDTLEHMKGCKGKSCMLARKTHLQAGQETDETANNINSIPFRGSRRRHGKKY